MADYETSRRLLLLREEYLKITTTPKRKAIIDLTIKQIERDMGRLGISSETS